MPNTEIFRFMNVRKPRTDLVLDVDAAVGETPFRSRLQVLSDAPAASGEAVLEAILAVPIPAPADIDALAEAAADPAAGLGTLADALLALRLRRLTGVDPDPDEDREKRIEAVLRSLLAAQSDGSAGRAEPSGSAARPLKLSFPMALVKRAICADVAAALDRPAIPEAPEPSAVLAAASACGAALDELQRGVFDVLQVPALPPEHLPEAATTAVAGSAGLLARVRDWLFGTQAEPGSADLQPAPVPIELDPEAAAVKLAARLRPDARQEAERTFGSVVETIRIAAHSPAEFANRMGAAEAQLAASVASAFSAPAVTTRSSTSVPLPPPSVFRFTPAVRVAGIGELFVAIENHKRYEAEEIAHVENVLPYEERLREHRSSRSTETLFERETSEQREREEDLRTSERFELRNETERTITETFSVEAGVDVTAKFGFISGEITVDSEFHVGYNRGVTETQRRGAEFAQEVIKHTVDKLNTVARELRRTSIREAVEELNRHTLKGLRVPYSGVYKWVNKIQEVQLRRYGQRLMIECYVPEPGARLIDLPPISLPPEPPTLDISPADILPSTYMAFGARFGASGLVPPPPHFQVVEYAWSATPPSAAGTGQGGVVAKKWTVVHSKEALTLPAGYAPIAAGAQYTSGNSYDYLDPWVSVGGTVVASGWRPASTGAISLVNLTANQPRSAGAALGIRVYSDLGLVRELASIAVTVLIVCERQPEAMAAWQLQTYDALAVANRSQWSDYRGALAQQAATQGTVISGRNPEENRELQRNELKRWSIELLRKMPFNLSSVLATPAGLVADATAIDGNRDIALFFERAFEWSQMTYWLHPYFWGRRSQFEARLRLNDVDPLHKAFLKAGAARVLLPVTPGFEERVLNYLESFAPEAAKVLWEPDLAAYDAGTYPIPAVAAYPEMWMEVVTAKRRELAYGTGSLTVVGGSDEIVINQDSRWIPEESDIGREIFINGERHEIVATVAGQPARLRIDRPYGRNDDSRASYLIGSAATGAPWEITLPTNLVVLADQLDKLNSKGNVNAIDPADVIVE